jgi:uncharacterized YigZ family protein
MQFHTYKTIEKRSEGLYKEKGSKFIGIAETCFSVEEVKQLLDNWKKEHHQARHLCYAYRLGADKKVFRANDDGEPSNSAGQPILGQLNAFDLSNTLVGVVRYYGGTKLGVGGLMNAYKSAALEAIKNGQIIERDVLHTLVFKFDHQTMPEVMSLLKQYNIKIVNQFYDNLNHITCHIPSRIEADFMTKLNQLTIEITLKEIPQ